MFINETASTNEKIETICKSPSRQKTTILSQRAAKRRTQKAIPCHYWTKGVVCPYGSRCWYSHGDCNEESSPNNTIDQTILTKT
ncbi:unnamed protein product, partial [Anisakis simplex]|uniref:C3H1-type domain-containing protein n=1 Tax=Anisakis simplex TaxID=6269 RepID=A0A0M3KGN0_ANISI